jgi:isocitrate dehydrogenase kinase/phosphatase
MELHGDLATPRWWSGLQELLAQGKEPHMFPYPEALRFSNRY